MGAIIRDITDTDPNPDLVRMLEHLLDRAKAGEIRSVVAVTSRADSATDAIEAFLADWEDLRGMAPDATGGRPSEEFVRELRDGWR